MPKAMASKGQQSSKMAPKPKFRKQGIRLKSFLVGMLTLHFALSALDIGLSNIVPVLALYAPSRQVGLVTNCFTHQEHGHTIHSCFRNDGPCEPANDYGGCPRTVDSTFTTPTLAFQKAMLRKKAFLLRQYLIDLADDVYSKVKTASNTWKAYTINPPKVKATVKVHEVLFSPPSQLQNWKAMFEGMRDMTKSNLVWLYSELATPFALTSLQNVRLAIDVVRCFIGLTIGFGAGIIFLGRAFRNPVTQLPTPSPVRRMYRGKLTRIYKVILSTVLLTWLWGYLAQWVLSPDNAFGPLIHFCAMVYWASVGIKETPFTALWHDIADFSATCANACANAFRYLRAFRTDRHAHAHFAEWASTWADHTTWCIAMKFCESLADPKAAFLFLFVYMGLIEGWLPAEDGTTSNANTKDKTASKAEPPDKPAKKPAKKPVTTLVPEHIVQEDYESNYPHDEVWEAELHARITQGQITEERAAKCAQGAQEVLAESESDDADWEKVSN